jgi:inosine-uridine nucleoside N-ribohydrolase
MNALKALELAGRTDIPVARGAEAPLRGKLHMARDVHGKDGLGEVELPEPVMKPHPVNAVDLMAAKADEHAGELTLVAVAPLTNIANAFKTHSDLGPKIKGIVLMGGSFSGGNITPHAEFNIYNDPEAADIVLNSGVPIIMVTLDVTRKTALHPEYLADMERDTHPVARLVLDLNDFYCRTRKKGGILLHDPLAVGVAINRGFVRTEPAHVVVETKGERRGETIADRKSSRPNVEICTGIDADRFVEFFLRSVLQVPR